MNKEQKTLDYFKDIVATERGFKNYSDLEKHKYDVDESLDFFTDQAAEKYAVYMRDEAMKERDEETLRFTEWVQLQRYGIISESPYKNRRGKWHNGNDLMTLFTTSQLFEKFRSLPPKE